MIGSARFTFHDLAPGEESFRDAVLRGLGRARKSIPCKFSLRYARIGPVRGDLPPAGVLPDPHRDRDPRSERGARSPTQIGPHGRLIEFGSGASTKARILLQALDRPAAYVPVDISREHLRDAAGSLAEDFPWLPVVAVCADYTRPFPLPPLPGPDGKRVGFFPGSTIGNFEPDAAVDFLANYARVLGPGGEMLIGVDLQEGSRDPRCRLQRPGRGDCGVQPQPARADQPRARRRSRYRPRSSTSPSTTKPKGGSKSTSAASPIRKRGSPARLVLFGKGELIHTEYSYKYSIPEFRALAARAGFRPIDTWTDPGELFSVHYFQLR